MGYNATVVVMLDALQDIERDPLFGEKLSTAISSYVGRGKSVDVYALGYVNAATVIEVHHADRLVPVLVGGNYGKRINLDEYICDNAENPEEVLLRSLADKLGFRVSKKPRTKDRFADALAQVEVEKRSK